MSRLCSLFGITRQAYYQYFWRESDYQIEEELLIQEVRTIRKRQPMIGTRKLYGMLDVFMVKHQIKVGRDALFDILSRNGMQRDLRNEEAKLAAVPVVATESVRNRNADRGKKS